MGGEDGEETTLSQISMQVYNARQHWHSFLIHLTESCSHLCFAKSYVCFPINQRIKRIRVFGRWPIYGLHNQIITRSFHRKLGNYR